MSEDDLQVLVAVANEIEANLIVGVLQSHGVQATATGGYTSGFKAEAPGDVQVLVRRGEIDRARTLLEETRATRPPRAVESTPDADSATGHAAEPSAALRRAWLAAVFGLIFFPPLLNLYSLWLILHHNLLPLRSEPLNWRAPASLAVNLLAILASAILYALIWLNR
jgi:hypothetical protein